MSRRPHRRRRRHLPPGTAPGTLHVDPDAPRPMIQVLAYGPDGVVEDTVEEPEDLGRYLGRWPVTWVNVDGLGDAATLERLGAVFGLHRLALEDVVHVHQRAKVEQYGDRVFIVARMVRRGEVLEGEQLSLFLGAHAVVTFQERPGDVFEAVRERIRHSGKKIRTAGADYLAYALLDAVVDGYFPVLEEFGERLEQLEERIFARPDETTVTALHQVRRELLDLRRSVWPQRDALNALMRDEVEPFAEETRLYLRDVYDHAVRVIDLVETYRESASSLMDVYLSSLSHRMNEVMKILTIIATIFIPLSFIAGVYGMNFDPEVSPWNMPELGWSFGYPLALAIMLAVACGLVWYFRRKRWL